MSQYDFGVIDPQTKTGTELAGDLNNWRNAVNSSHSGAARPAYVRAGMLWVDTAATPTCYLKLFDGTADITILAFNNSTHTGALSVNAAGVAFTPVGGIAATNVQAALQEVDVEKITLATADGRFLKLTGGILSAPMYVHMAAGGAAELAVGTAGADLMGFLRNNTGDVGITHSLSTGVFDTWLIRGIVGANRAVTTVQFDRPVVMGSNLNVTGTASSGGVIGSKSGQIDFSSAGLRNDAPAGDVHFGFHAVGVTAAGFRHVRGGAGVQVVTSDGATQAPITASNLLGVSQTVQDLTASRAINTTYTNSTARPIFVTVTCNLTPGGNMALSMNGVTCMTTGAGAPVTTSYSLSFLVGPGVAYGVSVANGGLANWIEYR